MQFFQCFIRNILLWFSQWNNHIPPSFVAHNAECMRCACWARQHRHKTIDKKKENSYFFRFYWILIVRNVWTRSVVQSFSRSTSLQYSYEFLSFSLGALCVFVGWLGEGTYWEIGSKYFIFAQTVLIFVVVVVVYSSNVVVPGTRSLHTHSFTHTHKR